MIFSEDCSTSKDIMNDESVRRSNAQDIRSNPMNEKASAPVAKAKMSNRIRYFGPRDANAGASVKVACVNIRGKKNINPTESEKSPSANNLVLLSISDGKSIKRNTKTASVAITPPNKIRLFEVIICP